MVWFSYCFFLLKFKKNIFKCQKTSPIFILIASAVMFRQFQRFHRVWSSCAQVVLVDDASQLFERLLFAIPHRDVRVVSDRSRPHSLRHFSHVRWCNEKALIKDSQESRTVLFLLNHAALNERVCKRASSHLNKNNVVVVALALSVSPSLLRRFSTRAVVHLPSMWGTAAPTQLMHRLLCGTTVPQKGGHNVHVSNAVVALLRLARLLLPSSHRAICISLRDQQTTPNLLPTVAKEMGLQWLRWPSAVQSVLPKEKKARGETTCPSRFTTVTCDFVDFARSRRRAAETMRRNILSHFAHENVLSHQDVLTTQQLIAAVETTVLLACAHAARVALTRWLILPRTAP